MKPYLLHYTSINSKGYKLVYAESEEQAIEKLKDRFFCLSELHITSETIK
jgi:hypothetical protein